MATAAVSRSSTRGSCPLTVGHRNERPPESETNVKKRAVSVQLFRLESDIETDIALKSEDLGNRQSVFRRKINGP